VIGSVIDGKYEIRRLIGQGGMGSVYEAAHTGTGRRCAVKVISSEGLTRDPNIVSRFQREARAAGAIDTQYIAQVLDAGVDRDTGLPFLIVEYLDGEDLQQLIKRVGPLVPDTVLRMAAQVCLGLQKAHDAKVVHRDIKPANLFLTQRDAGEIIVKMLDFGIAKVKMDEAHSTEGAELTRTGNLLGSPMYMSPEQARGQRGIDHRTDLYSLGAVMYQALSGHTPFQHATALGELILFVCSEPPPPLQDLAPWVTPEIAAIVHRCLTKPPAERFQTASEMFDALQPLLSGGWGIHRDMLVSLEEGMKAHAAPRLPMSIPPPPMPAGAQATEIEPATMAMGPAELRKLTAPSAAEAAGLVTGDGDMTTGAAGALAQSQAGAARAPKSKLGLVLSVSLGVAALGGAGVYWATRPSSSGPGGEPTATAVATTAPSARPSDSAPGTAQADDAKKSRRVQVVIIPADASVEIEGQPATVKDGILEITGVLGSVFRTRVFKGKGKDLGETTVDVVITETGVLPAKIEVKQGAVVSLPRPGATDAPTAGAQKPPPVPTGVATDMGEFGK
jgi:tRNA A-37 threonylcarbamoyl transferase component Bud32